MRWRDFDDLPPLPETFFNTARRVHFIGIGGIGMSALAFALKERGHNVSGSDARESAMLDKLRAAEIQCVVGHDAINLSVLGGGAEAIVFSSAVAPENAERLAANERGIPQWHRAQLLAYFVNSAKVSIAVSGTHGKSTTSAMIAHILDKLGHDPTALLGAEYPPFGSNVRLGNPDLVVVEADESDGSFTLLHPTIAVVTNVEPEHLENYNDSEDELWRAFEMFAAQTRDYLVLNADDEQLSHRLQHDNVQTFGISPTNSMLQASNVFQGRGRLQYDLFGAPADDHVGPFQLIAPGKHNLSNALAAVLAVQSLGVSADEAAESLSTFNGVKRRFQFIGEASDILVYDDYGHHPTEVASTLQTAHEFLERPIIAVFQPHRFSRTQQMGHLFGPSFEAADRVIITELYSAFEEPIEGVSGRIVFDSVRASFPDKPLFFAEDLAAARRLIGEIAASGDAVFCMGAGDITTLPPLVLEDLKNGC